MYHTQYSHDGGKDIEINFYDEIHKYKIWAECKQHKKNIGLEEIGKNVVLVVAHRVNKIIFFSASKIRESAKIEILRIGKQLNFDVQFLDENILKDELKKYPELIKKYFPNYKINNTNNSNKLKMCIRLNEIGSSYSENKNIFYLRGTNTFTVNIFINNTTKHYYSDINIEWLCEEDDIEIIQTNEDDRIPEEIQPFTDYLITYLCHVKTLKYEEIQLPNIILNYTYGNEEYSIDKELPELNLTKYILHPLQGKKYLEFISKDINDAIIKNKTGLFQYIEIEGKSGCGKSRIISEMKLGLLKNNYLYLSYDSYNYNDLDIIRKLICDIIGISYQHKNIFYDQKQLEKIMISPKITKDAAKIISKFVFESQISIDDINCISQYIVLLIEEKSKSKCIFISFDNIQNNNEVFFNILRDLIVFFENKNINIILVTALNIEKIPHENNVILNQYKKFIHNKKITKPNQYISFHPKGFEEDTIIFWIESLNRHNPNDYLVQYLTKKFGDNPLEVTMISDYLKQNLILKQHGDEEWYISNNEEFHKLMNSFFSGFRSIFKNKIEAIFELYPSYLSKLKELLSTIVLFNNFIDEYSLLKIIDSSEAMDILRNHSIIKLIENRYSFYHDSMYMFFRNKGIYTYKAIDNVYNFLQNNEIGNKNLINYNIYYYKNNVPEYAKLAKEILIDYINNFCYIQAIEFGKDLYNNNDLKKYDIKMYLQCAHLYAFACSSSGRKDESCNIFLNLSNLYIENQHIIDINDICDFFRDAINSQLQSNRFDDALNIIHIYKTIKSKPEVHEFLLYNREAVTYLSQNKISKAKKTFEKSLSIAKNLKDNSKFWISTTYSDIALMYFYSKYQDINKEKTIEYLNKAIVDYSQCADETIYRKHEISWHKSFIDILNGKYEDALNRLLNELIKGYNSFSIYEKFRIKNLIALCKLYEGKFETAIDELKDIKAECEVNQHSAAIIKLNNNIGVVYMQLKDYTKAYEYLRTAYFEIENTRIYLKMYPVASNYLLITKLLNKSPEKTLNKVLKIKDPHFNSYCKRICAKHNNNLQAWTMWNFNGFDYIF